MPSQNGLGILVRSAPLSQAEWFELIRRRVAEMKHFLDHLTLQRLANTTYLVPGFERSALDRDLHVLDFDVKRIGGTSCSAFRQMEIQGFFGVCHGASRLYDESTDPRADVVIWGLTRKAQWIMVKITYGYDHGTLCPLAILLEEVELEELIGRMKLPPRELYTFLSAAFRRAYKERAELLERVGRVVLDQEVENALLRLVPESE